MLHRRSKNVITLGDPLQEVAGTRWNLAELNSKDHRGALSSFVSTADVVRGEDGQPIKVNGRVKFLNKGQRKKQDKERAEKVKEAVDTTTQASEMITNLSPFQELENGAYRGDFLPESMIQSMLNTSKRILTPHLMDVLIRINDRMKSRVKDSGFLIEFTYNQVHETGKKIADIVTSYRQGFPLTFSASKTGRNFNITTIDVNDLMSRIDLFEASEAGSERAKILNIWRDEYKSRGGDVSRQTPGLNPVRDLFLSDLYLYLTGLSEGKTGIEALGGKGRTAKEAQLVKAKRDGLMRFLGFEKKDLGLKNENLFQQLVDKNRILKSYRLDRMQNLSISDQPVTITDRAYQSVQRNLSPMFKGEDSPQNINIATKPGMWQDKGDAKTGEKTSATRFHWGSLAEELDRRGNVSADEEIVSIPGLPKRRKGEESWVEEPADISGALREMDSQDEAISKWAKENNWHIPRKDLLSLEAGADIRSKGQEHTVYAKKGGWVVKATRSQMYGKPYKTPAQYLDQLNDYNSVASSGLQRRFLGVSEDERGVSVIVTAQKFQEGRPPKSFNEIVKLLDERGWSVLSRSDKSFRHEDGVEIFDVHEGNVIIDTNGDPQLFDVWPILPEAQSFADVAQQSATRGGPLFRGGDEAPKGDVPGGDDATLDMVYERDKQGNVKQDRGKPKIKIQTYDFLDSPLVRSVIDESGDVAQAEKDLKAIVTSLNTSKLDSRNKLTGRQAKLYDGIIDRYAEAFAEDFSKWKDDPDILEAIGWYSGVAKNISKIIPSDADRHIFLEFLGGTSPNTKVEQNFLYAIDLFNRWKSGGLKQYVDARNKTLRDFKSGALLKKYIEETQTPVWSRKKGEIERDKQGNKIRKTDSSGNPVFEYKWVSAQARNRFVKLYAESESGNKSKNEFKRSENKARAIAKNITPPDILSVSMFEAGAVPVRKNGGKYGVHTDRVFQIVEGVWEAETDAPKAVNFTGNLKGTRTTATIDVWAARFLRRVGYELGGAPWRIQPKAETGVKNSDFYFGQDVFDSATSKIADKYGDTYKMTSDDLQAVMWFAEKRNWAQKGWSRVEDFGDFRDYLYRMQQESDGSLKLKDAVLKETSEDFFNSLEFPAEDVQMPVASRNRRVDVANKILGFRRKIERARVKVEKATRQVESATRRVKNAKTESSKENAKSALKDKRKLLRQAKKSLDLVNDELRGMREIRMTMEEKPVTYSR